MTAQRPGESVPLAWTLKVAVGKEVQTGRTRHADSTDTSPIVGLHRERIYGAARLARVRGAVRVAGAVGGTPVANGSTLAQAPAQSWSPRVSVYSGYCLDQHFNANNQPTNTVYAWPDCHLQSNQYWSYWDSTYPYPIRNLRSTWCLEPRRS
jgi:hypothetical protein